MFFVYLYNYATISTILDIFITPPKELLTLSYYPLMLLSLPPVLGSNSSTFCLYRFAYLDILHKWNYTVLWTSFT